MKVNENGCNMLKILVYVIFSAGGLILLKIGTSREFLIEISRGVFYYFSHCDEKYEFEYLLSSICWISIYCCVFCELFYPKREDGDKRTHRNGINSHWNCGNEYRERVDSRIFY